MERKGYLPGDNPNKDPRLDFYSDQFDPLLALNTRDLAIPNPSAKVHDNLSKYKAAQDRLESDANAGEGKTAVQTQKKQPDGEETTTGFKRKWLPHQLPIHVPRKQTKENNLFTFIDELKGPLTTFKKAMEEKIKVKVWTRNEYQVRGYCDGYIKLFDKHWNILLDDVDEVWTRRKMRKTPAYDSLVQCSSDPGYRPPPQVTVIKRHKKTEVCKRHVDRFLIRGEQIVMVVLLQDQSQEQNTKKQGQ